MINTTPTADAVADARTVVAFSVDGPRRFRELLGQVSTYGSEAVVAALDGSHLAAGAAAAAAHAAFRAVPGLRG